MKKDNGTIFNPVMYLMVLILTAQLLTLFVEYKRMSWVSGAVTDSMTDALLGACTLNETELYHYGTTNEIEILYPKEKYDIFKDILCEELSLTKEMMVTEQSIELLADKVSVSDFRVYSVKGNDIILYDFDGETGYSTSIMEDVVGTFDIGNGKIIDTTTLMAEIDFTVRFFSVPIKVRKYHVVDVIN